MFEKRVIIDPEIRHGRPIIKGTSVPVEVILGSLAGGMEIKEIIEDYEITKEDIQAAAEYAMKIVANEEIAAYA
ncbi:hypothetical protein METP3_00446 [Methanosarcinales archaeon]|nr:hypothetical protein METP3_00446 [Methanosarcinales archaeon]